MLTEIGYRYLKRNGRAFKMKRDEVFAAFDSFGMLPEDSFIDFQFQFAGYHPEKDLTYGLFDPTGRYKDFLAPRIEARDGITFARFDLHNLLQIRFWLNSNGQIYEDNFTVASSFESYIQFYATAEHLLKSQKWTYIDNERLKTKRFQGFFDPSEMTAINHASDEFHKILRNDMMVYFEIGERRDLYAHPEALKGW